ncbi:MAG: 2-C-methyl-D-erythritol 2,4-cyclodiphosphate synthase [Clostridia bacterium]|nr:2-C-methyl-D-erythritol 2,4-cyclodiphosphate synthase [Clostridia bacterium]
MRIGHGYDVHRFAQNRKLFIGGIEIPYSMGLDGHSDADVLIHAICDALLGAAALGDIGKHFPDNDSSFKNIDSKILLKDTVSLLKDRGYGIVNIDATVIAQEPKLRGYIDEMRKVLSDVCEIGIDALNIKATTEEKLGFTGSLLGISAHAVCLIDKK